MMWSPTHIQVTVQRARNLQNKGKKGTNDAFVLIQMGKEKFQTSVKERCIDPEWYEECDLTLIGRDSDVTLTVFHRNALGLDEFLGQTFVSLQGIESYDRPFTRWYVLKGKTEKSESKNRGELEVKVAFIVRRCNDTQSLNDLSIKKKKHNIKNFAVSVGHKLQKLPTRSMSLKNLDPRKRIEKLREKRLSTSSDPNTLPEYDDEDSMEYSHIAMKRNSAIYSSTLSLPQSAMMITSIQEAESLEDETNRTEVINKDTKKTEVPWRKEIFPETKALNHGEWTSRILSHIKESPVARSETNLMEALKSESPMLPVRKGKLGAIKHNLRRHTLQLSEAPDLLTLTDEKRHPSNILNAETPNNQLSLLSGIPSEVIQQFEKMNHKDLVLFAIKQQVDLERQRDRILDLENYLDNLLVRVMETTPRILQKPYISPACSR